MVDQMETLKELCIQMQALEIEKDEAEENVKALGVKLDELRLKKIPDMLTLLELNNANFKGIGRVQLTADLFCGTKKGRKQEAMQWLRDQELGDMISETYNAASMKALIRRQMEQGIEIPDFMNVLPFQRASIVKS